MQGFRQLGVTRLIAGTTDIKGSQMRVFASISKLLLTSPAGQGRSLSGWRWMVLENHGAGLFAWMDARHGYRLNNLLYNRSITEPI